MSGYTEVYVAVVLALIVGTMIGIDPDKGKLEKWLYWAVAPLLVVALLSLAFKSLVAGFGFGLPALALLAVGYFRYRI